VKLYARDVGRVFLHPSSVNYKVGRYERDYVYIGAVGVWSRRDITPRHVEWCCAVDNLSEFLSKQGVKA